MKRIGSRRGYNLAIGSERQPTISIIVPTYNEATVIKEKLSNISLSDYRLIESMLSLLIAVRPTIPQTWPGISSLRIVSEGRSLKRRRDPENQVPLTLG